VRVMIRATAFLLSVASTESHCRCSPVVLTSYGVSRLRTHRKLTWLVDVSIGCGCLAAGR
jgi:hypothetical protein